MKNILKKSHLTLVLALGILIVGSILVRIGFAWTNPTLNPPLGTPSISSVGGNVGIGTAAPAYKLDVSGTINGSSVLNPTYAP